MAVKLQVPIELSGLDQTKKAFDSATRNAQQFSNVVTAISTAWLAFGQKAFDVLATPLTAAAKNEDANNRVATTLQLVGKYSDSSMTSMTDFARSLEMASGTSEETIKQVLATNLALGMNVEQSQAATKAAAGLAVVSRTDLVSANEAYLASIEGNVKGVKKYVQGVDAMNDATLRSGGAINAGLQQLTKFIGSDANSTIGTLGRVRLAFVDDLKDIGQALLDGFGAKSHFQDILDVLADLKKAIDDNGPSLREFGKVVGNEIVADLQALTQALRDVGPVLPDLAHQILDLMNIAMIPFFELIATTASLWEHAFGSKQAAQAFDNMYMALNDRLKKAVADLTGFKKDVLSNAMTRSDWDMFVNTAGLDEAVADLAKKGKSTTPEGWDPNYMKDALGKAAGLAEPTAAQRDPTPGAASIHLNRGLDKQQIEMQKQMRRQLSDETLRTQLQESNELIADYQLRLQKITDMEQQAADKGLDISRQAAALREAMADELVIQQGRAYGTDRLNAAKASGDKLAEIEANQVAETMSYQDAVVKKHMTDKEYESAVKESAHKVALFWLDTDLKIAAASGDTYRMIDDQLEQQLDDFKTMLANKLIAQEDYDAAVAEAQRNADQQKRQTTGSKSLDQDINDTTNMVNSISGGLSSIVSTLGSMFGPIGSLIAGIINLLDMAPDQFRKIVDGLLQALIDAPKNIMQNIPYLIAKVIQSFPEILKGLIEFAIAQTIGTIPLQMINAVLETLPNMIGKIFSIGFWAGIANDAYKSFLAAFKNFFSIIFTGKAITSALAPIQGDVKDTAKFGSDDPNAGGGQFKIKDADTRQQRQAKSFEDTFSDTVDSGGKSLVEMLKEFFNGMMDRLGDWFASVPGKLWAGLQQFAGQLVTWGTMIWNGFTHAVTVAWDWIKNIGGQIWNGFVGWVVAAWDWISKIGGAIWGGLSAGITANWNWLTNVGARIVDGITGALSKLWDWFKNFFSGIFSAAMPSIGGGGGGGILGTGIHIGREGGFATRSMANGGTAALFSAMGAMHFATGGVVPGSGFSDKVPALLRPNELVVTPEQRQSGALGNSTVINLNFNVAAGAVFDKAAVKQAMPDIIDQLRRETRNGTLVIRQSGIY